MKFTREQLKAKLDRATLAFEASRVELSKQDKITSSLHTKMRSLQEKYDAAFLDENPDNITFLLKGDSTNAYKKLCEFLSGYKLFTSGTYAETNQHAIQLNFHKEDNDDNELRIKGFKLILPHILPITEGKCTGKPFTILEHTLSENGSYSGFVLDDNSVVIVKHRYHNITYKKFNDFDTGMKYVQKNLYYSCDTDDEDDEFVDCCGSYF